MNGIITKAERAKISKELSEYVEEVEKYKLEKATENNEFYEESLTAGKYNLSYNTQKEEETGNIKTVIPYISDKYFEQLEIIKGELLLNTKDKNLIKVAQSLNIKVNPYDIVDGVLLSSTGNLLLMDENGTVTIPDTVTEIGEGAFSNLDGLKTIIIPGTVKKISYQAFAYNSTLENVIIQEGVETIGGGAFRNCTNLKKVQLPESIKTIGGIAFCSCHNLNEINIPESITRIEQWTFAECAFTQITLPSNLTFIGEYAFKEATLLISINIPSKVTSIGKTAFNGCSKLTNINLTGNNNFIYENGMLMTSAKDNILFLSDSYMKSIATFSIPEGVTSFNVDISRYNNINKIIIPSTLSSINISSQTSIFPSSISEIEVAGGNTYFEAKEKCLITKSTKKLVCCYLKDEIITIPEGVKTVGTRAFAFATKAKTINETDSLESIEGYAFYSAKTLKNVNLGRNVKNINGPLCTERMNLSITISSDNPYFIVDDGIIYSKDKTTLVSVIRSISGTFLVPEGVKVIEASACSSRSVSNAIIPNGCEEIKTNAFAGCSSLTKITIPSSMKTIGTNCFDMCSKLDEIIIDKEQGSITGSPWQAPKGQKAVYWKK